MSEMRQPENRLVADLERQADPDASTLRTSLAVGSFLLGRLTLPEASELAGMRTDAFRRLVAVAPAAAGEEPETASEPGPRLSIVIPVRDGAERLRPLYRELAAVLPGLGSHEMIFVDDGSTDESVDLLLELRGLDPSIKVVRLSRRFGHQAALAAGLDHARGEAVVFMDGDGDDPPALLTEMVGRWEAGNEVVYAVPRRRPVGRLRRSGRAFSRRLLRRLAETEIPPDAGDYCLMDRRVADVVRQLPERRRFLRGLRSWAGFRQAAVPYDRAAPPAGAPRPTRIHRERLTADGLLSFSSLPLRFASYLGFLTALAGIGYIVVAVFARLFIGDVPEGWTSIVAIVLTVGGAQLMLLGLLGEYLARLYDESKQRPLYVVRELYGLAPRSRVSGRRGRP